MEPRIERSDVSADIETLKGLLVEVRKAKGPDKFLDADISNILDPDVGWSVLWPDASSYTASLDAALALVTRCLPAWDVCLEIMQARVIVMLTGPDGYDGDIGQMVDEEAATPALALVAACLSALIAEKEAATEGVEG